MSRCIYKFQDICTALTVRKCEGCKFRKTESEFISGQNKAAQRLKSLGLEPVIVGKGHNAIMTTRPIDIWGEGSDNDK